MASEKSKMRITENRFNEAIGSLEKGYRVRELRLLARERGLKRYSKLKKAELIELILQSERLFHESTRVENAHILDEPVLDNTPSLQPNPSTKPKRNQLLKQRLNALGKTIQSELNKFADSVVNYIPPAVGEKVSNIIAQVNNIFSTVYKNVDFKNMKPLHNEHTFEVREALKGTVKQYIIEGVAGYDVKPFLDEIRPIIVDLLTKNRQVKVYFVLSCDMERVDIKTSEKITTEAHFHSKSATNLESTDVNSLYSNSADKMMENMANYQSQGSNWRFKSVVKLTANTIAYKPFKGSSHIPLPPILANKKAIVNMENKDDQCFKWCITRALNPIQRDSERITKQLREQSKTLDWRGIEFPVAVDANVYVKFEKNNNVNINVFGYEEYVGVYPIYISAQFETVDLLLISDGDKKHYCWIKNLNKLMANRTDKSHNSMHYCKRCLQGYSTVEALNNHDKYCSQHGAQKIELPKPGSKVKFQNYNRSMRVPFVVYADFESFIKPIDTCQPDPSKPYTNKFQKHEPSSICYKIVTADNINYNRAGIITAENENDDVAHMFIDCLIEHVREIYHMFKSPEDMIFAENDEKLFEEATTCHICDEELGDDKVRDHCHITGEFRGAAHNGCNINYKIPKFFPVYFHNLSGYDGHLLIKKLRGNNFEKISCIPNNEEKYVSFSREVIVDEFINEQGKHVLVKRELRFLDSFRFMPSSLESLTKTLTKQQFKNLDRFCRTRLKKNYSECHFELLLRKGVYPYDYMDSLEKFNERRLPPKSAFYSKLNNVEITDDDYAHARRVWEEFNCKTMRDYHNLYNKCDVLQLSDIFEHFRDVCMKHYKLDPAWYYTSPGLSWDAMLKRTLIELELLSDPDMILMIKNGIRGGVSTITTRYGKSNNKYMGEAFDEKEPSKFIIYLDSNNLYGWAMNKPLPTHGFEWMTETELNNWRDITNEDGVGCILEVDLEYPETLHDLHNDYPLAPESIKVDKVYKLIPNLNDKKNYVLHCENLKMYESMGLIITKIHRGIRFNESPWLKTYIDLNTNLRTKATNDFEKDFFKLMNNSVFGKTMENIENHVDIRLVCNKKEAVKLSAKTNYDRFTIFDKNLIAVHMKRTKLKYNKPIYLGMCILDLSKTLMYDMHYNYMKNKYGDKAKLLFTDTDSLMYEIQTADFYKDIADDIKTRFDTSEYPKDHASGIETGVNKKVLGMFKDEAAGKQIYEFIGLRPKSYSYEIFEGDGHKKCKGIKRNVVKTQITHADYKNCLVGKTEEYRRMNVIRSHRHDMYTEEINKIALSADDDKRVIMADGIHTVAIGHYITKAS
jgi:Rho termination factor, N-terminal domain